MSIWIIVAIVIVAGAIIGIGYRSSRHQQAAPAGTEPRSPANVRPDADLTSFHLDPVDFRVQGHRAIVSFDVEAPVSGLDPELADLLIAQAIEVVRDRRTRGLPLAGISTISVLCRDGDEYIELATTDLEEPGTRPVSDASATRVVEAEEIDPLDHFAEIVTSSGIAASSSRGDDLPALGNELRLTAGLVAALEGRGVERSTMTVSELTKSLLDVAGYELQPRSLAGTYLARRAHSDTYLAIVDHEVGSYPELSEDAINSFLAGFYSSKARRGLLVSDKFGPHLVYQKERRDDRVRFITRERLQAFVDSIAAVRS